MPLLLGAGVGVGPGTAIANDSSRSYRCSSPSLDSGGLGPVRFSKGRPARH